MNILKVQLNSITIIEWIAHGGSIALMVVGLSKTFSVENIVAMIILIFMSMEAFSPMITLTSSFHVAMTGVAAGKNLIDFFALPEQDEAHKNEIEDTSDGISVKDLSFSYPDSERIILKYQCRV